MTDYKIEEAVSLMKIQGVSDQVFTQLEKLRSLREKDYKNYEKQSYRMAQINDLFQDFFYDIHQIVADSVRSKSVEEGTLVDIHTLGNHYVLEEYFKNEHRLKKEDVFWTFSTLVWIRSGRLDGQFDQQWIEAFNRYKRLKMPLMRRMTIGSMGLNDVDFNSLRSDLKQVNNSTFCLGKAKKHIIESVCSKKEITIYRKFKVRKGKPVRKGLKKLGNEHAEIQEEGRGWSYTLGKGVGRSFLVGVDTEHFYKKLGKLDDEQIRKRLQNQKMFKHYTDDRAVSCLGTYKVKVKDILIVETTSASYEVVVEPEKVKLQRYDFLSWEETFGGLLVTQLSNMAFKNESYESSKWFMPLGRGEEQGLKLGIKFGKAIRRRDGFLKLYYEDGKLDDLLANMFLAGLGKDQKGNVTIGVEAEVDGKEVSGRQRINKIFDLYVLFALFIRSAGYDVSEGYKNYVEATGNTFTQRFVESLGG